MTKQSATPRNRRTPLRIGFLFNPGRLARVHACESGEAPTDFFYGAMELKKQGYDVRIFETSPDVPVHWPSAAFNYIGQNGPVKLDGLYMQGTRNLIHQLNECDVIVGTTSPHAFALAIWNRLRYLKPPVVGIQCGLFNHPINWSRKQSTAFLMRKMQSVLFGEAEYPLALETFPGIGGLITVNQFGVDTAFWTPGSAPESGYVLAVGKDGRRDYNTLIQAAAQLPYQVIILTSITLPPLPPNVKHIVSSYTSGITDTQLRDLYRGARCVVVPLHPTTQPSGQSVTLQAMACSKPVILSRTQGIWSPNTVQDNKTIFLAPVENPAALAERITQACTPAGTALGSVAREAILQHGRIENFAEGILAACQRATAQENPT